MNPDEIILNHYRRIAKNFGLSICSGIPQEKIKHEEMQFFLKEIQAYAGEKARSLKVLDVGHGNGYTLEFLARKFPRHSFSGFEFTPELYEVSTQRNLENYQVWQGDARKGESYKSTYDIIYTERVLINLLNFKDKLKAMGHIAESLKPGGLFLMSESFEESTRLYNKARAEFQLEPFEPSPHNQFLTEKFIEKFPKYGLKEREALTSRYQLSTFFYTTKVLHKAIRRDGDNVAAVEFDNFLNLAFPSGIGKYTPIQFRVFEKED